MNSKPFIEFKKPKPDHVKTKIFGVRNLACYWDLDLIFLVDERNGREILLVCSSSRFCARGMGAWMEAGSVIELNWKVGEGVGTAPLLW